MNDARSIIAELRAGNAPSPEQLRWFMKGLADGQVSDAQAGAFAMAICLQGLDQSGRAELTLAMRDSGETLKWALNGPVIDKHSTGGIGDCVSLVLAPALAACGAFVPMISGRGLGHTGGTLDKLESIPGVRVDLDESGLRRVVNFAGVAIIAASANVAPADKRLYGIRDVTATVQSLDLITASILSKKLAAGLDHLVLDVKIGSGALMKSLEEAQALARSLVDTANLAGCPTTAVISDMSAPLAPAVGNALEVAEVMEVLCNGKGGRLLELSAGLGGVLLSNAGLAKDVDNGVGMILGAISKGRAAEQFGKMIYAQGGPVNFAENWQRFLPEAPVIREVTAPNDGYIAGFDGEALGLAAIDLGAGRKVETDLVDAAVGFSDIVALGAQVRKGQPILTVHAAREDAARIAAEQVMAAIMLSDLPPEQPPLIYESVTP